MSTNHIFKLLLLISIVFSTQVQAATNFNTFPNLQLGSTNSFVQELQKVLNSNGFPITTPGLPGSQGMETTKFGLLTQKALKSFQTKYKITPVTGNFASKTKAKFNEVMKDTKVATVSKGKPVSYGTQRCQSITQWEITWTFAPQSDGQFPLCGTFANGDWWVVGPVIIADINPPSLNSTGGSMINIIPGQTNGLSLGGSVPSAGYDASKNIALQLPYTINSASSLISTITQSDGSKGTIFKEIAVLTILETVPASGSFRPPYSGTDKTIKPNWNISQLDYPQFRNIDAPYPGFVLPDRATYEAATDRPLLEYETASNNTAWKAASANFSNRRYGREIADVGALAGVYLNMNVSNSEKEHLLINMTQWGIDTYGLLMNNMVWLASGGHQQGRKLPLFIAAKALNDDQLLEKVNATVYGGFQEDQQHFYVSQTEIDYGKSSRFEPYTQSMLGMPEWGPGAWERTEATPQWDSSLGSIKDDVHNFGYRFVNGGTAAAAVWVVTVMGGQADYNNQAYFDYYIKRYFPKESIMSRPGNDIPEVIKQLWSNISDPMARKVYPVNIGCDVAYMNIDCLPTITMNTYTVGAQIYYTLDGSTPTISSTLYTGPVSIGGSTEVKAVAVKTGMVSSDITSTTITIPSTPLEMLPSTNWTLQYVDSQHAGFEAVKLFDNNKNTLWHTVYTPVAAPAPHEIQINLGGTYTIGGFSYLPRQDVYTSGNIGQYEFYVSTDGVNWGTPVASGTFVNNKAVKYVKFARTSARYIRLRGLTDSTANPRDPHYMSIAELEIAAVVNGQITTDDQDFDGVSNSTDKCPNTQVAYRSTVNTYGCPPPILTSLKLLNNIQTIDYTNVGTLEIEDINSVFGRIRYSQPVNIFGSNDSSTPINLDSYISIQDKKVTVNTTNGTQFNKPATVTLYNVNMTRPQVMKDGTVYASSTSPNMSYDPIGRTLTFTADGF